MDTTIILNDGTVVEVDIGENQAYEIAHNKQVDTSIDKIQALLKSVTSPISNTFKEMNKDLQIDSATVTIGVKIDIEGNFLLAKSTTGANIQVEMSMKPSYE